MKRLILPVTILLAAALFVGCGDDNKNGGNEPEPSGLTPDQHKAKLENIGKEFVSCFHPEDSRAAIESLTTLLDLLDFGNDEPVNPPSYLRSAAASLLATVEGSNPSHLSALATRAATEFYSIEEALGSTGGELTYNTQTGEWEIENNDTRTVRAHYTDAKHTSVLKLVYSAESVVYNYRDEAEVEVPNQLEFTLEVDGSTQLAATIAPNLSADGRTIRPAVQLTLNGGYEFRVSADANPSYVTCTATFAKNERTISTAYAKVIVDGMTDPDNWIYTEQWNGYTDEYTDPGEYFTTHVKTGECSLQILTACMVAQGNIRAIIDGNDTIQDCDTKEGSEQEAALYNLNASAYLSYTDDNTKVADMVMQSYLAYQSTSYTEYDIEPVLVFGDGSRVSVDSFLGDAKFSSLVDTIDDLLQDYLNIIGR